MATFVSATSPPVSGNTNDGTNTNNSDVQRQLQVGNTPATAPKSGSDHIYNRGNSSLSTNCGREALRGFQTDNYSLQKDVVYDNNDYKQKQDGSVPSSYDGMSQRGTSVARGNNTDQVGSFTPTPASDAASAYYKSLSSFTSGSIPIGRTNPVFITSNSNESYLDSTKPHDNVEGRVINPSFLTFTDRSRIGELLNNGDATIFGIKLAPESLQDPNSEIRRLINNGSGNKTSPAVTSTTTPLSLNQTSFEQSIASSVSATIVTNTNARGDIEREIVIRIPLPTVYASELPRRVSDSSVETQLVGTSNETALKPSVNMSPSSLQAPYSSVNIKPSFTEFYQAPKSENNHSLPRVVTNPTDKPTNYLQSNPISVPNTVTDNIPSYSNSKPTASANSSKKKRSASFSPEAIPSRNLGTENAAYGVTQNPVSRFNTLEQDAADVLKLLASSPKNYIGGTAAMVQSKQTTEDDGSDDGSDLPKRRGDSEDGGCPESGRVYVEPAPSDVLLGRGGRTNKHQGNRMYLQAKCSIQGRYMQAPKEEKTQISQNLVDMVREWGGRFLKLDEVKNLWYEVPNSVARKKASQTLREITPPPSERSSKRAKMSISAAQQGYDLHVVP